MNKRAQWITATEQTHFVTQNDLVYNKTKIMVHLSDRVRTVVARSPADREVRGLNPTLN